MEHIWSILGFSGAFGLIGFLLNLLLKKFLTEENMNKWKSTVSEKCLSAGNKVGIVLTAGFSKWKFTAAIWNPIVEPYVIVLLDFVGISAVVSFIKGIVEGLKTDNESFKTDKSSKVGDIVG